MAATSPSTPADPGPDQRPHWSVDLLKQVKQLPEWLNVAQALLGCIGTFAVTAVGTFALQDRPWAYTLVAVAGTVVVLGFVVLLAVKARRSRAGQAGERSDRAILLGIAPIEHAPLPMRGADAQRVLDMVKGLDYRFGVLVGKSGAGKTSLIRAEVLPRLVRDGYIPVYLPRSSGDILAATRVALGELFAPGTAVPEGGPRDLLRALPVEQRQRVILIYDQFDDLLLTDEESRRTRFVEWAQKCIKDAALKVRFLFVMRSDVFAHMQELLPSTPGAWSIAHRHVLGELSPEDALGVLKLVGQHEARFGTRLMKELANDLSSGGKVSPVLLQIVATSLKQQGITSKRRYRALGEAAAILEWYVVEQMQGAADPRLAHDVLKHLTGAGEWQPGVGRSLESILAALGDPASSQHEARKTSVCNLLARLTSARLVVLNVDRTYSVPHPILHTAVMSAVAQVEAEEVAEVRNAVALLGRYVTRYQNTHLVCIPFWHLWQICRNVPARLRIEEPAQTLLWRSVLVVQAVVLGVAVIFSSAGLLGGLVKARVVVPYDDWDDPILVSVPSEQGHQAPSPNVVGFFPGSKRLVLAHTSATSNQGELYTLDYTLNDLKPVSGQPQATLRRIENDARITALALNPRGNVLASGDASGVVKTWKPDLQQDGEVLAPARETASGDPCTQPAVSFLGYGAEGIHLIVSRCQFIEVWNTESRQRIAQAPLPEDVLPDRIRVDPKGDYVALIEASQGEDLGPPEPDAPVIPASQIYVLVPDDGVLRSVRRKPVAVRTNGVLEVGFAPGSRLVVAMVDQGRLFRLTFNTNDAENPDPEELGEVQADTKKTAMSTDGTVIALTDNRTAWWIWRGRPTAPEVLKQPRWSSSFMSADGKVLLLTGSPTHTLLKHDLRLFHPSRLLPPEYRADPIASLLGLLWQRGG